MDRIVIDVREPHEYASGHYRGSVNIPPEKFLSGNLPELSDVGKDAQIIVYCRTGARSNVVMNMLKGYGFTNVTNGINKDQVEKRFPTT